MRKDFLYIFIVLILTHTLQAQTRGTKVGYIDMEYILQNVPDYTEAQSQLEQKAQKWKQEVEAKKNEINKLKEALKAEKALLTKIDTSHFLLRNKFYPKIDNLCLKTYNKLLS